MQMNKDYMICSIYHYMSIQVKRGVYKIQKSITGRTKVSKNLKFGIKIKI